MLDADIVCERARNHYDPSVDFSSFGEGETSTSGGAASSVQRYKDQFQPIHASMRYKMLYVTIALPSLTYPGIDTLDAPASSKSPCCCFYVKSGTQMRVQRYLDASYRE
jgi:hypothetical protein